MAFISQQDVLQIVRNGGGVRIRSSSKSTPELVQIAANAAAAGARVEIVVDAHLAQMELVQIAANGKGVVLFDFASS